MQVPHCERICRRRHPWAPKAASPRDRGRIRRDSRARARHPPALLPPQNARDPRRDAPLPLAPPEAARLLRALCGPRRGRARRAHLEAGPPPIYIGFGSIVLDNPDEIIKTILESDRLTGVRAIISKGWSELAGSDDENIYWIGDCPHEWLFQHVAAVIHHGGAGTTACGLRNGKPTTIIPFFGE